MAASRRLRLRWVLIAVGAAVLLTLALLPAARTLKRKWRERRVEVFTDAGFNAWQQGRGREAAITLESAERMDPAILRPRMLRARLLLQSGDNEGAARIYRGLMEALPPSGRRVIAANYHDALVGTANWAMLLDLSMEQLASDPQTRDVWTAAALESVRLAPSSGAGNPTAAGLAEGLPLVPATLLAARLRLKEGNGSGARSILADLPGPMNPVEARMAARILSEAGDAAGGRACALNVGIQLGATDLALVDILAASDDPEGAARAAVTLCARAADPAHQAGPLLSALSLSLRAARERVAENFDRGLDPISTKLSPAILTAVWLLNELAGREEAAFRWRERVQSRQGLAALPRSIRPLTTNTFLVLTQYLQMPRTLVYGLVACLPDHPPHGNFNDPKPEARG